MKNNLTKIEIEKQLKRASLTFTPDVLDKIQTINATTQVVPVKPKRKTKWVLRFAMAAVIVFVAMTSTFYGVTYNQSYEKVVLELNPSVEFTVNQYDNVIGVTYLNEDAEILFNAVNVKGQKLNQVLKQFVLKAKQNGYFGVEDPQIYLTLVSDNTNASKRLTALTSTLQQALTQNDVVCGVLETVMTKQQERIMQQQGTTNAKYVLINAILALDSENYTQAQLNTYSVQQLRQLLRTLSEAFTQGTGFTGGNGNGQN